MKASTSYPIYTAVVVGADGTKYQLQNVTTDLMIHEPDGEIANKVTLKLRNVKTSKGSLESCLALKMRLYIYANDGEKKDEVYRGYLWKIDSDSDYEEILSIVAFDHLRYLQRSKDCLYFSAGKTTDAIFKHICSKWGINVSYNYDTIKHPKLPLNNKYIADMFIEILDAVKNKVGTKYVIRSIKDVANILKVGSNKVVYCFREKKNVIAKKSSISMDDMVTKVIIVGNKDDDERQTVEATVTGNTSEYGTLQDIVTMSGNTTLSEAKKEAQEIIKEKGKPTRINSVKFPDVPWVHKGDLIEAYVRNLNGKYIVKDVTHDALSKTMSLEVEKVA